MTLNPFIEDGFFNHEFLDQLPAVTEDEFVKHVRFENEMIIKIDGRTNRGIVLKPVP